MEKRETQNHANKCEPNNVKWMLQNECYEQNDKSNIFIARDLKCGEGYKEYNAFKNIDTYLRWLRKQSNKSCYEQIRFQRCEYYDIDEKLTYEFWKTNISLFKSNPDLVLDCFFQSYSNWLNTTDYPDKDIFNKDKHALILKSTNSDYKISFHIIIRNGYVFQNLRQNQLYMEQFCNYLKQNGKEGLIDTGVYTINRCFRTIHCTKMELEKVKERFLERSKYNEISQTCDESLFFASNIIPELNEASLESCISMKNEENELNELAYIENGFYLKNITTQEEIKEEKLFEQTEPLTNEENNLLFNHLSEKRWDDFNMCRNLIWIAVKMSLSERDIHMYCRKSSKYNEKWVQRIIRDTDRESKLGIGTLLYYLREDVDRETYYSLLPKTLKYADIMKKDMDDWTEAEQEFVRKMYIRINESNLDKLTKTTLIDPILCSNDNFVTSSIYFKSDKKINIIRAGLGRGKSQSVSDFIKKSNYISIVVLTPRRSYAKSAKERLVRETGLPFICYSEQKKSLIEAKYVVIQAESLYRLDINTENNLLIIDEVEAFLYQLTSVITHKDNHIKNVETFIELVKQSQKVIALDAFISDRTLQTFKTLSGIAHIDFFEFTIKLKKRKAVEIDNIDLFINAIISDLEKGKKIFLFSSSNTKLLNTKIKHYKPDKHGNIREDKIMRALIPAIREKFPDKNILEFHSKFMSVQLSNVNDDWSKADLVCCTSTITVGCNFDVPDVFHKVYLYANASSRNLVRDMFQASWRVRHLIDDEMVYCLDENHYGMNVSCNIKEIREKLENKNELLLKLSSESNIFFKTETPNIIKHLVCINQLESNLSIMNLRSFFDRYLEICNYEKSSLNEDDILEVIFEEFEGDESIEYKSIPTITMSEAQILTIKKISMPLLELEYLQLEKFHFRYQLLNRSEDVEEGLWKIYKKFGKGKFRNISIEKGFFEGTCTIQDIIEKESYSHLNSGTYLRVQVIQNIIEWVGMESTSEYGFNITKDKLNSIIEKFEESREQIHIAFDMRDQAKGTLDAKSTLGLINKIFERWNYSKIVRGEKQQKKVKGKVLDVSEYKLVGHKNDDIDIASNIKPYRKSNKERKMHPLLLCKDDAKIITNEELENIRLKR